MLRHLSWVSLLITFFALIGNHAEAEPFWTKLVARQVEADAGKDYRLSQDHGPWLIMATTFSGDGAESQAHELVLELRKRYKLEAYLHEMTFDFTEGTQGIGIDHNGEPLRMRYRRADKIREIAVLIGNFPTIDDPELQKTIRKIKYMQPDSLDLEEREATSQNLAALRTIQRALLPEDNQRAKYGPMGHAFATRNPMIPKEYFSQGGLDPQVLEWNNDFKYSLLKNPAKFTVKVATFTGRVVIDQEKIRKYEHGKQVENSQLAEAGDKAHQLTLALRAKGYDAYVFHDRAASIVCVGAFDSVGSPRADGKIEINPQIHAIMETFRGAPLDPNVRVGEGSHVGMQVKSLAGIPLDIQPQIVHVPKEGFGTAYMQR